jgi:hypothetical protein
MRTLEELNVSRNQLAELPDAIGSLHSLQRLNFSVNSIRVLPPSICDLAVLDTLDASKNQIEQVPPELGQLQALTTLNLSDNKLRQLPDSLGRLTRYGCAAPAVSPTRSLAPCYSPQAPRVKLTHPVVAIGWPRYTCKTTGSRPCRTAWST